MKYTSNIGNKLIILLFIISFTFSCTKNDNDVDIIDATVATQFIDVSYGSASQQIYDIYLPKNRSNSKTKVLVMVHGGSWVSGDKNDLNGFIESLKQEFPEYAIVNLNYQLATIGKSPFPMQIDDLEKAISHLKSKSDDYAISTNYGFIGVSAGAHLSMVYTFQNATSNNVKMVCSIVGPTNFTDENYISNPDYFEVSTGIQLLTGINYEANPEYYKNLSPYHIVTENAPPTILFYGGKDNLIPTSQGVDLHMRLDELGVINEFTLYENEGHGWEGDALNDTYLKLKQFILSHF